MPRERAGCMSEQTEAHQTMECYSVIKGNELWRHTKRRRSLQHTFLRERGQSGKAASRIIQPYGVLEQAQGRTLRKDQGGCQGLRGGRVGWIGGAQGNF